MNGIIIATDSTLTSQDFLVGINGINREKFSTGQRILLKLFMKTFSPFARKIIYEEAYLSFHMYRIWKG